MTLIIPSARWIGDHEGMDPLAGTSWSSAATVDGFVRSAPNLRLINYAARLQGIHAPLRVLDIGCGAGRNAVPLAQSGAGVTGTDLSWPMLQAASSRLASGLHLVCAPMNALPLRGGSFDLIVAHGIWNLARSASELRAAIRESARVAADAARLFIFTFSRSTLAPDAPAINGETFVFSQFAGCPQVFLTENQLLSELGAVGFTPDPDLPLRELNLPPPGRSRIGGAPVIFEGGFRFAGG